MMLHNDFASKHKFCEVVFSLPPLLLVLYSGYKHGLFFFFPLLFSVGNYDLYCLAYKILFNFFSITNQPSFFISFYNRILAKENKGLRTSFSRCDWPCSIQGRVSFALAPDKSLRRFFKSIDWGRCSSTLESLLKCPVIIQGWGKDIC